MSLPILQATSQPTPATLVRLFHQTEIQWTRHLAEEQVIDLGTAFFNPAFPQLVAANLILDASVPATVPPVGAMEAAREFYRQQGVDLLGLIPAPSTQSDALEVHLATAGLFLHRRNILRLTRRPAASPLSMPGGVKIIPARASFRHARELALEMSAGNSQHADAILLHLDDPHVDALLALRDGAAAASISVLAMGEVGRIDQLFVSPRFRRQGLGRLMLSRALEICARALFKHVLLSVSAEEFAAQSLFAQFGFESIGSIDRYQPANDRSSQ
jgi:ribosomal protein S18 acetylase RimI-like enzyme